MGRKCGFELEKGAAPVELGGGGDTKHRFVSKGLNLYGICKNESCKVYNEEVICMMKGVTEFNFSDREQAKTVKCPLCNNVIESTNCGFYKCKYSFYGEKYNEEEDDIDKFDFSGEALNDYKKFKPVSKEVSEDEDNFLDKWLELIVKIEFA